MLLTVYVLNRNSQYRHFDISALITYTVSGNKTPLDIVQ